MQLRMMLKRGHQELPGDDHGIMNTYLHKEKHEQQNNTVSKYYVPKLLLTIEVSCKHASNGHDDSRLVILQSHKWRKRTDNDDESSTISSRKSQFV